MLDKNVNLNGKIVLVTGAAGFIGCNLCKKLLSDYACAEIVGIDSISDYYDVNIKYERLNEIEALATSTGKKWTFIKANLADKATIDSLFEKYHFAVVVQHLEPDARTARHAFQHQTVMGTAIGLYFSLRPHHGRSAASHKQHQRQQKSQC